MVNMSGCFVRLRVALTHAEPCAPLQRGSGLARPASRVHLPRHRGRGGAKREAQFLLRVCCGALRRRCTLRDVAPRHAALSAR